MGQITRELYKDGVVIQEEIITFPDPTYDELRKKEYPPVGDQLDAIWKALDHINKSGTDLPQEVIDMLDTQILSVKNKYPKPEDVISSEP